MRVIPVMDVRGGVAVHAVAGRRADYRPVRSVTAASPDPRGVAAAFREKLGLADLYVADLDAIAGGEPDWHLYSALAAAGHRLLIDAGLRDAARGRRLANLGAAVVAGLETCPSPDTLADLVRVCGSDQVIFSLDLRGGSPILPPGDGWGFAASAPPSAIEIARRAIAAGARRMILLDLSRVGVGGGVGTEALLGAIRALDPAVELILGGGVAGIADLVALRDAGADAVLVASALHNGRIGPAELARVAAQ